MTINDLRWWEQAACRDAPPAVKNSFVLSDNERYRVGPRKIVEQLAATVNARKICATCPVAERCLKELWADPHAVAGGLVPAQRHKKRPPTQTREAS